MVFSKSISLLFFLSPCLLLLTQINRSQCLLTNYSCLVEIASQSSEDCDWFGLVWFGSFLIILLCE